MAERRGGGYTYRQFLPIEHDLDTLAGAGDVVGPPGGQGHYVFVQLFHLELGQVRLERDASEVLPVE